jgi:hypothetical protein
MSLIIDGTTGFLASGTTSLYANGAIQGSSIAAGTVTGSQLSYINSISSSSSFTLYTGSNSITFGTDASITNNLGNINLSASNVTVSSNLQVGTSLNVIGNATAATMQVSSQYLSPYAAFRNRLHNGDMRIAQRNAYGTLQSRSITSSTAVPTGSNSGNNNYAIDRWFCVSNGGTVTLAQVAGTGSTQYRAQITGGASVSALYFGQRIEQAYSYDLAGTTCTLAVDLSNSLLTSVTYTISYANSADTFGTIGTATKTTIATGSWTVTNVLTRYTVSVAIPAAATTGIEILFSVGAQTSGTWVIGNAQFEQGVVATVFDRKPYTTELLLCQRYCPAWQATATTQIVGQGGGQSTTSMGMLWQFPVAARIPPSQTFPVVSSAAHFTVYSAANSSIGTVSGQSSGYSSIYSNLSFWTVASGVTVGQVGYILANTSTAFMYWDGCEIP